MLEQIDQSRERQLRFGTAGPSRKNAKASLGRKLDASLPQRRLADARLANEHERAAGRWRALHELLQRRQFPLATDHPGAAYRGGFLHGLRAPAYHSEGRSTNQLGLISRARA